MAEARRILDEEKNISPALRAIFGLILVFMEAMLTRLGLNSQNSSKPPSTDEEKKKRKKHAPSDKKPGGQPGRIGKQLKPVSDPDIIHDINIDKRSLPHSQYNPKRGANSAL